MDRYNEQKYERAKEGFCIFIDMTCKKNAILLRHINDHVEQELENFENELCDFVLEEETNNSHCLNPLYKEEVKQKIKMFRFFRQYILNIFAE